MMENTRQLAAWTLGVAILGIITCLPFGLSFYGILSIVVCAFSIYLFVKIPRDAKATRGALLIIIASAIMLIGMIAVLVAAGGDLNSLNSVSTSTTDYTNVDWSIVGPAAIGGLLFVASWIVRIVGTVFAFIDYSKLKKATVTQDQGPM